MQRLMLGVGGRPSLLVKVLKQSDEGFDFRVINGAWDGKFTYTDVDTGSVFIEYTKETVDNVQVLCENQDRLRGDYNDVFFNFDDESYVAPQPHKVEYPDYWDDDIAF